MTHKELINKCLKKDARAQEQLYKQFAPKLMGLCRRYAKNHEEAQDVFQEGFIKVFANIDKLKQPELLESWLKRIFVNTAINYFHQQKKHHHHLDTDELTEVFEDNVSNVINQLSHQELLTQIAQLPDRYRMVFNLYIIEGFKHHEIAEMLKISEGTSKSQLFKAKAFLKEKLAHVGITQVATK